MTKKNCNFASSLFFMLLACGLGCRGTQPSTLPQGPIPLGTTVDGIMHQQEDNAELAKFVIYMHEFELNKPEWKVRTGLAKGRQLTHGHRLTPYGQDHVRQIAARLREGAAHQVVVERNQTSIKSGTEFRYAVHYGDDLDRLRRHVVVQVLSKLGVTDAEQRVIVAPAFAPGMDADAAARAYNTNFTQRSGNRGAAGGSSF